MLSQCGRHGFDSCRGLTLFGHDEHYDNVSSGISANYCISVFNYELKNYQRSYTFLPFLVASLRGAAKFEQQDGRTVLFLDGSHGTYAKTPTSIPVHKKRHHCFVDQVGVASECTEADLWGLVLSFPLPNLHGDEWSPVRPSKRPVWCGSYRFVHGCKVSHLPSGLYWEGMNCCDRTNGGRGRK